MSAIPFRIMIHGLIALAPALAGDGTVDPTDFKHITALLLDTAAHHEGECMSLHVPKLSFIPVDAKQCRAAGCEMETGNCVCTAALTKKKIRLDISPEPILNSQPIPQDDESLVNNRGLPANKDAAGSFRYIANLSKPPFSLTLDTSQLNMRLAARMEIPFTGLTACRLTWREDQGDTFVHAMSFRKMGFRGLSTDRSQALAQMVMARFDVDDAQPVRVILHISSFDGTGETSIEVDRGDKGYFMELSNEPEKALPRDSTCDDGVARHFAAFYSLASNKPPESQWMIPHLRYLHSARQADLEPEECKDPTLTFIDRPVCPMGSFVP